MSLTFFSIGSWGSVRIIVSDQWFELGSRTVKSATRYMSAWDCCVFSERH